MTQSGDRLRTSTPGSPFAIQHGCSCPRTERINRDCPLHGVSDQVQSAVQKERDRIAEMASAIANNPDNGSEVKWWFRRFAGAIRAGNYGGLGEK